APAKVPEVDVPRQVDARDAAAAPDEEVVAVRAVDGRAEVVVEVAPDLRRRTREVAGAIGPSAVAADRVTGPNDLAGAVALAGEEARELLLPLAEVPLRVGRTGECLREYLGDRPVLRAIVDDGRPLRPGVVARHVEVRSLRQSLGQRLGRYLGSFDVHRRP